MPVHGLHLGLLITKVVCFNIAAEHVRAFDQDVSVERRLVVPRLAGIRCRLAEERWTVLDLRFRPLNEFRLSFSVCPCAEE